MRVILSAGKRGHYYLTAVALQEQGLLERFITSTFFHRKTWRRWVTRREIIAVRSDPRLADRNVVSLWPVELAYRAVKPLLGRFRRRGMHVYNAVYDMASAAYVHGADVFHFANTYGLRSAAAARRRGMKVVADQQIVHPHYMIEVLGEECERLGTWDADTDRASARRIVRELALADLVLVPSRFVFEENVRHGIAAAKQRIVPFGVDTSLFTETTRRRRREDPFRILFVGSMSARKGVLYLLDAVQRLADPRVELTLVGTAAPDFEPMLDRHGGRFRRIPTLSHGDLAALYRESDCLCLPSLAEGSALVTYEAMASGLPCVVTRSAGSLVEEGKSGIFVPIRSPEAIAEAFLTLANDPEFARALGRNARTVACDHDVRQYGKRLADAYADSFGAPTCVHPR